MMMVKKQAFEMFKGVKKKYIEKIFLEKIRRSRGTARLRR